MLHLDMDPYLTAPDVWIGSPESWPDVSFPDICTYLLFSPSPCTKDDLKAYKSTEAWTYVTRLNKWLCKRNQIAENKCRLMFAYSQGTISMKLKSACIHCITPV